MVMGVAFGVLLAASVALVTVGVMGLLGRLPRSSIAGIRTGYTTSSDERWIAVHRAAAPLTIFGGVAVASVALSFFPFAVAGRVPEGTGSAVAIAVAIVVLLIVVMAAVVGIRTAKAQGL